MQRAGQDSGARRFSSRACRPGGAPRTHTRRPHDPTRRRPIHDQRRSQTHRICPESEARPSWFLDHQARTTTSHWLPGICTGQALCPWPQACISDSPSPAQLPSNTAAQPCVGLNCGSLKTGMILLLSTVLHPVTGPVCACVLSPGSAQMLTQLPWLSSCCSDRGCVPV